MFRATVVLAYALMACESSSSQVGRAPVTTHVVVLPDPDDEVAATARSAPTCPADTLTERGVCVRIIASPEIPSWTPPSGHLDPCATWTSDAGIYDCDPTEESVGD